MFKSEGIDTIAAESLVSKLEPSLSEDHSRQLEKNINMSELENALWSFKTNKSPGEDGLPIEWYRQFWYLIKHEFLNITSDILDSRTLTDSQYKGVITLIYKHGDRDLLKNWRPITLLNCDYKIVAKCFAERIKPHLPNLITPDQKGYIKGRYINEANRLLKDIIDYTDREKNDGIIIFLDQTKAFDRCEWPWIQRILKNLTLGQNLQVG